MNLLRVTILFFCYGSLVFPQSLTVPLYDDRIPEAKEHNLEEKVEMENGSIRRISMVSEPTIDIYFPNEKNGTAILICPGGGYSYLSYTHEGITVAKWLNDLGITGIVLKSRLPDNRIMEHKEKVPLTDAQKALEMIRKRAKEWEINDKKVGIMGFSAGGHLAAAASTLFRDTLTRPDFSVLVYPVITMDTAFTHMGSRRKLLGETADAQMANRFSAEKNISKNTPPAFLVHSFDDRVVPAKNSLAYYEGLKANEVKGCELHVFPNGNHGYGLALGKQGNVALWTTLLQNWMQQQGYLNSP